MISPEGKEILKEQLETLKGNRKNLQTQRQSVVNEFDILKKKKESIEIEITKLDTAIDNIKKDIA